MTMASLTGAFGAEGMATPLWGQIMSVLEAGYEQEKGRAEELGKQLKEALFTAFKEGLTADNINAVQSIFDEMNELIARQQNRERYVEQEKRLRQAQTLGYDSLQQLSTEARTQRDEEIEQTREQQDRAYFDLMTWYDDAIAQGMMVSEGNGRYRYITEDDREKALAALKEHQQKQIDEINDWYAGYLMNMWYTTITESDIGDEWTNMAALVRSNMENGGISAEALANYYNGGDSSDFADVAMMVGQWTTLMGGMEEVARLGRRFRELSQDADLSIADRKQYEVLAGIVEEILGINEVFSDTGDIREGIALPEVTKRDEDVASMEELREAEVWAPIEEENAAKAAAQAKLAPYGTDLEFMQGELSRHGIDSTYIPETEEIEVDVGANTFEFESAMDSIQAYDGDSVRIRVAGDTSDIEGDISRLQNKTIRIRIAGGGGMEGYAEGGRAVRASVFGEAGPEWAIPEEHSARTAELLDSARQASGFTWPELLSRTGGLNADANHITSTIIYSPTINAQDSRGVDQALREDKDRFERWYEQKRMLEEAMAY